MAEAWEVENEIPDPQQAILYVQNKGPEEWRWLANSRPIVLKPGETKPIPRWAYDLGCKFEKHPLIVLDQDQGTLEYEETKAAHLAEEMKAIEETYAKKKAALEEAQERAKAKRADAKKHAGKGKE